MRKLFIALLLTIGFCITTTAQNANNGQTSKGNWLLEANTGTWATGNTSFSLTSIDGNTAWSIGAEAGYFVEDNLAIKLGLGYSDLGDFFDGSFVYKVGAKYYIDSQFPVGVDFTGASNDGNGANWLGLQGGYAIFLSDNVSLEPAIRYNLTLDEEDAESAFQALVGFVIHL